MLKGKKFDAFALLPIKARKYYLVKTQHYI